MPYRKNILYLQLVSTYTFLFFSKSFSKIWYVYASEKMHGKLEAPALDDRLFKALEVGEGKTELHSCAVTAVHALW